MYCVSFGTVEWCALSGGGKGIMYALTVTLAVAVAGTRHLKVLSLCLFCTHLMSIRDFTALTLVNELSV